MYSKASVFDTFFRYSVVNYSFSSYFFSILDHSDPWNSRFVRFIASFCYNLSLPFFFPSCLLSFPLLYLLLFIYYLISLLLILSLFHPFSGNVSFVQAPAAERSTRKVDPVCVISWPHQWLIAFSKWVFYVKCSLNLVLWPRPPRWYDGPLSYLSLLKSEFSASNLAGTSPYYHDHHDITMGPFLTAL